MLSRWALPLLLPLFLSTISTSSATTSSLSHSTKLLYSPVSDPSTTHDLATILYDPLTSSASLESWTPPTIPSSSAEPETNLPLLKILTSTGQSSTLASLAVFNTSSTNSDNNKTPNVIINLSLDTLGNVYNAYITAPYTAPSSPPSKKLVGEHSSNKPKSKARLEREAREAARDAKAAEKARIRSAKKAGTSIALSTPSAVPPASASSSKYPNIQIRLQHPHPGPAPKLSPPRQPRLGADGQPLPPGQQGVDDQEQAPEKSFLQKYWWVFLVMAVLAFSGSAEK